MDEVAITKILQLRCCDPRDAAAMQTFNLAQKVAIYTMGKKGLLGNTKVALKWFG